MPKLITLTKAALQACTCDGGNTLCGACIAEKHLRLAGYIPSSVSSKDYAHFCRDGHAPIGYNDSENERCPLCRAIDTVNALLEVIQQSQIFVGAHTAIKAARKHGYLRT